MRKLYDILLIEPNSKLAHEIIGWLKKEAHVVHVQDYNVAKKLANQNSWHLVITDINSPEVDSIEITQMVKKIDPNTAILIIAEKKSILFLMLCNTTRMVYFLNLLIKMNLSPEF